MRGQSGTEKHDVWGAYIGWISCFFKGFSWVPGGK